MARYCFGQTIYKNLCPGGDHTLVEGDRQSIDISSELYNMSGGAGALRKIEWVKEVGTAFQGAGGGILQRRADDS